MAKVLISISMRAAVDSYNIATIIRETAERIEQGENEGPITDFTLHGNDDESTLIGNFKVTGLD